MTPMRSAFALLLAACAVAAAAETSDRAHTGQGKNWRRVATRNDRARISHWHKAWTDALAKAKQSGSGDAIAREGSLLQPDSAIAWADPPAGTYRCRTLKLGSNAPRVPDFVAYPWYQCRLRREAGAPRLRELTGPQRPIGRLYVDTNQAVFLGTLQLGDETRSYDYGKDQTRDLAGLVQRIAPDRWRIVLPEPHFESMIDIIELEPAGGAGE